MKTKSKVEAEVDWLHVYSRRERLHGQTSRLQIIMRLRSQITTEGFEAFHHQASQAYPKIDFSGFVFYDDLGSPVAAEVVEVEEDEVNDRLPIEDLMLCK